MQAWSLFYNKKFIILKRKFDFLNKFMDIFGCAYFISRFYFQCAGKDLAFNTSF